MSTRRDFIKKTAVVPGLLAMPLFSDSFEIPGSKTKPINQARPRIIIETDAGGDPDDEQSLVRFLLFVNEFDVEGIIANRPVARENENKNPVRDGLGIVKSMIKAYGECYPNLIKHNRYYPHPDKLLDVTVPGYDDTEEGVNLVIKAVDRDDPRPLWFCNWGTDRGSAVSCLLRALDRVMTERGIKGYSQFKSRIRLSSSDKFGSHTTTQAPPFPLWIDTFRPEADGRRWYHRFSAITAKAGGFDIERDVRTGHGPLGEMYPLNTTHPQKEGDTMSFLYLLPHGLSDPAEPGWGSWGGRYGLNEQYPGKNYYWANLKDDWEGSVNRDNTVARWAAAFQNDFRARMDWCVKPYGAANHHPVAVVNGNRENNIMIINGSPGKMIVLDAGKSFDPDKRKFFIEWFVYSEAGSYGKAVPLSSFSGPETSLIVPEVSKPETIHVILQLRNDGDPPLYGFRRIVIKIKP